MPPEVKRDLAIRNGALGVLVILLAAVMLLSERPLVIGDRPTVLPGPEISHARLPPDYVGTLDDQGAHVPKLRHRALMAPTQPGAAQDRRIDWTTPDPATPVRLGWSIIETDILGMPFWYRKDDGQVIYYETDREYVYGLASEDYFRQAHITAPKLASLWQPWWRATWGWVFVLAFAAVGAFEWQAGGRRREALGML